MPLLELEAACAQHLGGGSLVALAALAGRAEVAVAHVAGERGDIVSLATAPHRPEDGPAKLTRSIEVESLTPPQVTIGEDRDDLTEVTLRIDVVG